VLCCAILQCGQANGKERKKANRKCNGSRDSTQKGGLDLPFRRTATSTNYSTIQRDNRKKGHIFFNNGNKNKTKRENDGQFKRTKWWKKTFSPVIFSFILARRDNF
jgi:hypothetical protein